MHDLKRFTWRHGLLTCLLLQLPNLGVAKTVDEAAIIASEQDPAEWLSHGRTYSEQRYSPLKQINTDNVAQLDLAWHIDLKGSFAGGGGILR